MKRLLRFILAFCLLSGISCTKNVIKDSLEITPEEYTVISALFESSRTFLLGKDFKVVLINDRTGIDESAQEVQRRLGSLPEEMKELSREMGVNLLSQNQKAYPLDSRLEISFTYHLLPPAEAASLVSQGGRPDCRKAVERRYPGAVGIFTVSRPGFNEQKDKALLYIGGSLCKSGVGLYVLMKKENGVWVFAEQSLAWIS